MLTAELLTEPIANIIFADGEFGIGPPKGGISYKDGNEYKAIVVPFRFGDKTKYSLLNLKFECQNCGNCCKESKDYCENVTEDDGKYLCSSYNNRPLACLTYPFTIDEDSREKVGFMKLYPEEPRLTNLMFGYVDGGLTLQIYTHEEHWHKGNKPVKHIYREALEKLAELHHDDQIYPPVVGLFDIIDPRTRRQVKPNKKSLERDKKRFHLHLESDEMKLRFRQELLNL
jgi:Fe-S-cluster containining protein